MAKAYPIVYIRGYAMTQSEVEDTFNRPYYGFNLGSTQIRQSHQEKTTMRIFESPVVRLLKEEGYTDSFNRFVNARNQPLVNSVNVAEVDWHRTLWVFRFYDLESKLTGEQDRGEIEDYAGALHIYLDGIRHACGNPDDFRVNLVAHSMGGLIARCYLQNEDVTKNSVTDPPDPVKVNKLFTYGTPHKGISLRKGLGWAEDVRDLVGFAGSDTFGETEMRRFLALEPKDGETKKPLHTYNPLSFAPNRKKVFSLVGTNYQDYVVWAAKKGVGPGSDGLVAIENAYIKESPRAFIHRSHSGPFGIVNSEAGFQNLVRFLFGNYRFDIEIAPITVKRQLLGLADNDTLDYILMNLSVAIRGLPTYVQYRSEDTQSALVIPMDEKNDLFVQETQKRLFLYTGYFRAKYKMDGDDYLRGAVDIRIEPHYKHDGWIRESRFEGEAFFTERLHIAAMESENGFKIEYRWSSTVRDKDAIEQADGSFLVPLPRSAKTYIECDGILIQKIKWD